MRVIMTRHLSVKQTLCMRTVMMVISLRVTTAMNLHIIMAMGLHAMRAMSLCVTTAMGLRAMTAMSLHTWMTTLKLFPITLWTFMTALLVMVEMAVLVVTATLMTGVMLLRIMMTLSSQQPSVRLHHITHLAQSENGLATIWSACPHTIME
ncbi:hypothetical protein EV176_002621 [Coemansia sp. RSA 451]|nr:hypothetical protein EV176_002621 [Coemansia sp. RSA 451]